MAITDNIKLRPTLIHHFMKILNATDEHLQRKNSPVTPEQLGDDLVDACNMEGWDTTLLFWDYDENPRYNVDQVDDHENPSQVAADIARRLLDRYEMKRRT